MLKNREGQRVPDVQFRIREGHEWRDVDSEALFKSIPQLDQPSHTRLEPIPGRPPDLLNPPVGCAFAARCHYAQADCLEAKPPLQEIVADHSWACFHAVGTPSGDAALAANTEAGITAAGLDMTAENEEL